MSFYPPSEGGTGLTPAQLAAIASIAPSLKSNLAASSAPTANDDSLDGYSDGSTWIYGGSTYTCTDATAGAAVWSLPSDIYYFADWPALVAAINVVDATYIGKYASVTNANGGPSVVGATYTAPAAISSPIADGNSAVYKVLVEGVGIYSVKLQSRPAAALRITSIQNTAVAKPTTAGFYIFTVTPSNALPSGVNLNDIAQLVGTTWSTYQSYANAPVVVAVGTSASAIAMWNKAGSSWEFRREVAIARTPLMVWEFGAIECLTGAWDGKTLTLGGMTFKWSQAAISGGYLTYIRSAGSDATGTAGGQTVRKFVDSTVTGNDGGTDNIWPLSQVGVRTTITMGSAYQSMEYNIMTRSNLVAHWCIKVYHNGSNNLFISGTYMGPKYTG